MFFTKEDYLKIEEYLRLNSMKDTDFKYFPEGDSFNPDDIIVIVHNGTNYKLPVVKLDGVLQILDDCIITRMIANKAITPEKLSDDVKQFIILSIDEKYQGVTDGLDIKYQNITNELRSMIEGVIELYELSLSPWYGLNTDRGIQLKTLTDTLHKLLTELQEISHRQYINYNLTVYPLELFQEGPSTVKVIADSSMTFTNFESVKVYVNDVLKAECGNETVFITDVPIVGDSVIRVEGMILGKPVIKEQSVKKYIPFFMGGGSDYTEIMNDTFVKELVGTLEGDYDVTIPHDNDYLFIIIPISRQNEFRRADMNGLDIKVEIPFTRIVSEDYVIYKSINTYRAGTYNIDIDINS